MVDEHKNQNDKANVQTLLQSVQPGMPLQEQEKLKEQLQQAVNYLIVHQFEKLVQLLYIIDVDEKRLKSLLKKNQDKDAASFIADLLIERQLQKAALRQRFSTNSTTDEAEKW